MVKLLLKTASNKVRWEHFFIKTSKNDRFANSPTGPFLEDYYQIEVFSFTPVPLSN